MKSIDEQIGTKIAMARKSRGLTQSELAKRLGYESATAVSLIESGKRQASAALVFRISVITGMSIHHFFNRLAYP